MKQKNLKTYVENNNLQIGEKMYSFLFSLVEN